MDGERRPRRLFFFSGNVFLIYLCGGFGSIICVSQSLGMVGLVDFGV